MPLARSVYRARQFARAMFPKFEEHHLDLVRAVLAPGELALFESMERRDQRHGIRVMEHLRDDHHADRDLLAAALLHDCGKGRVPLWLRVAYVGAPWLIERLASRSEAAYRLVQHAGLGAGLAERAGCSMATVRYISGSVAEHEHDKIAVLRAADDKS